MVCPAYLLKGLVVCYRPPFDFTSQYIVKVDDFFLHYLQKVIFSLCVCGLCVCMVCVMCVCVCIGMVCVWCMCAYRHGVRVCVCRHGVCVRVLCLIIDLSCCV